MTLEIDLVRALREPEYREEISAELESDITSMTMLDAADEIERLRAALKEAAEMMDGEGLAHADLVWKVLGLEPPHTQRREPSQ